MPGYFSFRLKLVIVFLSLIGLFGISATSSSVLSSYSPALRRYPYLTDAVASYTTINWGTDRSDTSGGVRYGKAGSEACTAHYVAGSKTPISVNGVLEYQWKAQLNLVPGTQYCYRVYLGTSPVGQIDLLGSDPAPSFWSQVPSGGNQPFSFVVFGDWGMVDSSGANPYQASLMSLIASSGARFVVTTGDNGYPDGNQKNLGDLIQIGQDISAVFGPSFWKLPGASLPIFPILGNHGYFNPDTNHPALITWPQDRAVSLSQGRYLKETYCCLDGTTSKSYPSAWYAFDAGPARFYILNAAWDEVNIGTASEYQVDYDYHWAPGTDQYEWLRADLQNHPSVLKFAFLHYPLYSDNPIESTDTFLQGNNSLEGLLKQYDVDLAFTGHAHIYERNFASASGIPNYITGGGGAELGTLGTCTSLDAYAIKFTTTGKACGSAPLPTSAAQIYHFLKVTVNRTSVNVTPINSLGQAFDVVDYTFTNDSESTPPATPTNLHVSVASGTQINLSWSASTDNTRVRGYSIYRDGVLVNTVGSATFSYSDKNLHPSTTYVYHVDAFDPSGNHSGLSTPRSARTQSTGTYTFEPVADAYVAGDFATTNFGTSAVLKADATPALQSYLRFNVGDVNGTVTKAILRLYTTSSSAAGYQVRRVNSQGWEEGSVSYAGAPSVGSVIGSSGNFAMGNWTNVNVTSFVTGNGVYDFALTTTSTATLNFNSREAGSNQPQLVIETVTDAPGTAFTDVPADYWAGQYITTLYAAGITGGCATSPLMYCPASPVTRAQMAVFLLRAIHGSNYAPPAASGVIFRDVSSSYWAAPWIERLVAEGITAGCGNGNYCPEAAVTRDQMAVFLLRAEHGRNYSPPTPSGALFGDVSASYWAAAWIEQLVAEGITAGCGNGSYCPASSVTRDQMAVFLVRTFNL
jgi:chitodextrinase